MENIHIGADFYPEEIASFTYVFKEFHNVFSWSYDEMPGIYPSILKHEIKIYDNAKLVCQRLWPIQQRKTIAIKSDVENLLHVGFIYPVPLTRLASNLVPVDKILGAIHVCVNYKDLNTMCPKYNYLTLFINQIINTCTGFESFSFIDGFSGYNPDCHKPVDQHKMPSFSLGEYLHTRNSHWV